MSPSFEHCTNSYETTPDEDRTKYEESFELAGYPAIQKSSKEDLLKVHSENVESLAKATQGLKEFALFAAYAPAISSLRTLQKISVQDLKLETHHRGSFVTGKTITRAYQSTKLITLIQEDETGCVAKLVLDYDYDSIFGTGTTIPENSTVAIKEPYCKSNGEGDYVISVDHPSDIAVLRGDDAAMSMIMEFVRQEREIIPAQWKSAGDKAFLTKNYTSAIDCYTQAIDTAPTEYQSFVRDTRRKRAFANLSAKSFRAAKEDALATCAGDSLDEKAYFYAGRAAYMLGEYVDSKGYFKKALQLHPGNLKYQEELTRVEARSNEEERGVYDFRKMHQSVFESRVHLDNASFISRTEIRDTTNRGRGLFSNCAIRAGDLVLCEKAFCLPDKYTGGEAADLIMYNFNNSGLTQRSGQAALFLQLTQKLYRSSEDCERFFNLDGGAYIRSGSEGKLIDGVPIVDTFLVEAIRLKNCFSSPRLTSALLKPNPSQLDHALTTGLWMQASYLNHSCLGNCTRSFVGDMMIIRANIDIAAGTELTHQYLWPEAWYPTRKERFQNTWSFECDCRLCSLEAKSPESSHNSRNELVKKIKKEVLTAPKTMQASTIHRIQRLTRELEELHEPDIYGNIPRTLLIHPTIWLTEAYRRTKVPGKTLQCALDVLRNFGHINPVRENDDSHAVVLDGDGIKNSEVFNALRFMAESYRSLGKRDLSEKCLEVAKDIYMILTGSEVGLEEGLREGFWGIRERAKWDAEHEKSDKGPV